MPQSIVVGLGELLWDCFADSRKPGGAPANVAFHANQLGCRGVVCSRVGTDELGNELIDFLTQQQLETRYVQRDPDHPTGTVTIDTSRADDPQYVFPEDVAWDNLELSADWRELLQGASAVCFGTLAQRAAKSRETILGALAATPERCKAVYDVNLREHWYDGTWIERSLQMADIVKLNRDEVGVLRSLLDVPGDDEQSFAEQICQKFAVDLVCITRGSEGCLLATADECISIPGIEVTVKDAVGAGDAFTAALIVTQLQGRPLQESAEFANRIGGLVASKPGAMPALKDEFAKLKAEYNLTN